MVRYQVLGNGPCKKEWGLPFLTPFQSNFCTPLARSVPPSVYWSDKSNQKGVYFTAYYTNNRMQYYFSSRWAWIGRGISQASVSQFWFSSSWCTQRWSVFSSEYWPSQCTNFHYSTTHRVSVCLSVSYPRVFLRWREQVFSVLRGISDVTEAKTFFLLQVWRNRKTMHRTDGHAAGEDMCHSDQSERDIIHMLNEALCSVSEAKHIACR